jgi:hypothetical protein
METAAKTRKKPFTKPVGEYCTGNQSEPHGIIPAMTVYRSPQFMVDNQAGKSLKTSVSARLCHDVENARNWLFDQTAWHGSDRFRKKLCRCRNLLDSISFSFSPGPRGV